MKYVLRNGIKDTISKTKKFVLCSICIQIIHLKRVCIFYENKYETHGNLCICSSKFVLSHSLHVILHILLNIIQSFQECFKRATSEKMLMKGKYGKRKGFKIHFTLFSQFKIRFKPVANFVRCLLGKKWENRTNFKLIFL